MKPLIGCKGASDMSGSKSNEKHRQESTLGVDAWVETSEDENTDEGFLAAAKMIAGEDPEPDHHDAPEHKF